MFPEQATNWRWMMDKIASAGRPVSVLNLFAYTGGATVAAASAGAQVVHVDLCEGDGSMGQGKRGIVRTCRPSYPLYHG